MEVVNFLNEHKRESKVVTRLTSTIAIKVSSQSQFKAETHGLTQPWERT